MVFRTDLPTSRTNSVNGRGRAPVVANALHPSLLVSFGRSVRKGTPRYHIR